MVYFETRMTQTERLIPPVVNIKPMTQPIGLDTPVGSNRDVDTRVWDMVWTHLPEMVGELNLEQADVMLSLLDMDDYCGEINGCSRSVLFSKRLRIVELVGEMELAGQHSTLIYLSNVLDKDNSDFSLKMDEMARLFGWE